jgi:hypothetical protein
MAAVVKNKSWLRRNWKGAAATAGGAGLLTWIMVDDDAGDKAGDAFGKVGGFVSGLFGGLFEGLMPLISSSSIVVCILFCAFSVFTALMSQLD